MPDPTVPYLTGDRGDPHFEDPLLGFNFALNLEGMIAGYFTECTGIGSEHDVVEHKVVDKQGHEIVRKIPGRLKWQDVTLKRGVTSDLEIWKWRQSVIEGDMTSARQNISIQMLDRNYTPIATWHFQNAWPSKVTGPQFKADSNEFGIEEVTIVHEGMYREV
jgi:phage tail-like protein